ncbi:MAG: adenylyltransferase/cytidyltransferase family protein [Alphaproteobacteria bacterium]|nr:adenylyltransferase/cytidyltransferase family protein [Alphaproteobacteria bacterium]MBV9553379.1 adenylyltransferase/cytidyltransferase family protein [Alphaproteobacteria bacterium]
MRAAPAAAKRDDRRCGKRLIKGNGVNEADLAIAKPLSRKAGERAVSTLAEPEYERKVLPLPTLSRIADELRANGRTIVLAHGTFDLLHIGHVRHLQAARRHGDVLVVTITADAFINKGPGRPVFPEGLRSEMLASLAIVDYVGVVAGPDALPAIEAVKPHVYIKGQDYRNPEGDITGRIVAEREAAEEYGGRVVFTEEITYSSTELINQHLNIFDSPTREHLDLLRRNRVAERIDTLLERASELNVLVVGEAIIDEYRYVLPMGKAPKENIIATRLQDREVFIGGAVATANNAAAFCNSVELLTIIGERDSYEQQMRDALKPNVTMRSIVRRGAPTTHKCRYVDPTLVRKLFEVYMIEDAPLSPRDEDRLCSMFRDAVSAADVVIVNDFGHGMIGDKLIETIAAKAPFLAINAQTNSANMGFNLISRYRRADLVCIDALEARLASKDRTGELTRIINETLPGMIDCDRFLVTNGRHGSLTYARGEIVHSIPAFPSKVVDTMGAGDAVLAVAAPLVASGAPLDLVGFIGNVVGAQKVAIVGHQRSIDRVAVLKALTALLK